MPQAPAPSAASPAAPAATWQRIASWTGSGIKTTESFTVGPEWKIVWSTQPGQYGAANFQIYVSEAGTGAPADVAANIIGAGSDESYVHHAGTYYLEMNSGQPWAVEVWDKR